MPDSKEPSLDSPINPMKALFWSAFIHRVVAVPLMAVLILMVSKKSVMNSFTASRRLIALGWIAVAVMGAAAGQAPLLRLSGSADSAQV